MTEGSRGVDSEAVPTSQPLTAGVPPDERVIDLVTELTHLKDERDTLQRLAEAHAAELETLSRVKEEFIATASHDLKAPLTSILGYSQHVTRLLSATAPDLAKVMRGMTIIQDQARAMTLLLDDLLDASRIQIGAFGLRVAPCEISTCLDTVLTQLAPGARERIDVTLASPPLAGIWDQQRIEQVLANLVSNALKYSPDTKPISIVVKRGASSIEVSVSDLGVGIPARELPRLFERFYRTPGAYASGLPGSGLGLYICHGIITSHGGRLWAESAGEGQGATFRFTLPDQPSPDGGLHVA